jgi:hypothetical protein
VRITSGKVAVRCGPLHSGVRRLALLACEAQECRPGKEPPVELPSNAGRTIIPTYVDRARPRGCRNGRARWNCPDTSISFHHHCREALGTAGILGPCYGSTVINIVHMLTLLPLASPLLRVKHFSEKASWLHQPGFPFAGGAAGTVRRACNWRFSEAQSTVVWGLNKSYTCFSSVRQSRHADESGASTWTGIWATV